MRDGARPITTNRGGRDMTTRKDIFFEELATYTVKDSKVVEVG